MANFEDEMPLGGNFDLERIVIDPDYRRMVIANLRADRLRAEAARHPPPADPAPAAHEF